MISPRTRTLALLAGLALVTGIAYGPALSNQFTNWDDTTYVLENPTLGDFSPGNLARIFSRYYMGNYHPLSLLSLSLDHRLGGTDPFVYHLSSLLLHGLCTALVLLLARDLIGGWIAPASCALLFGVHPLHVESVAWVSARKDLLYACFYFAACLAWLRYARAGGRAAYTLALLCFLLSLLSKGMAVAFPLTALAIHHTLGHRLLSRRVILGILPCFALSLLFGAIAFAAQHSADQLTGEAPWTFGERSLLASRGFSLYLAKLFYPFPPFSLSAWYPYPEPVDGALPAGFGLWLLPTFLVAALFVFALARSRILAFGLAFVAVNVFFVLPWFDVGYASLADRYTYVASFGSCLVIGAGFQRGLEAWPRLRAPAWLLLGLYAAALATGTHQRSLVWHDSVSLWSSVLEQDPDSTLALQGRSNALLDRGDALAAKADLDRALRLLPDNAAFHVHRGIALQELGDFESAARDLDRAIALDASSPLAWLTHGNLRQAQSDWNGALSDYDRALTLQPQQAATWYNRGNAQFRAGQLAAALADYEHALGIEPRHAAAHHNAAVVRHELGDDEGALAGFSRAIAADPGYAQAWLDRGHLHIELGQADEGCADLRRAAELGAREDLEESCPH